MQADDANGDYIRESVVVTLAAIGYCSYATATQAAADDYRIRQCFESLTLSICENAPELVRDVQSDCPGDEQFARDFGEQLALATARLVPILERFRTTPSPLRESGWARFCAATTAVDRLIAVDHELLEHAVCTHDIFAEPTPEMFAGRVASLTKIFTTLERLTAARAVILLPYLV